MDLFTLLVLPVGLGLLGFIEPCSIGSTLIFVKFLGDKGQTVKIRETLTFTATRALFLGLRGAAAAFVGGAFIGLQKAFWILLGTAYVVLGLLYLARRTGTLMFELGFGRWLLQGRKGAAALGLVFALNIPACAAPLLAAVLATSLGVATVARGFVSLAVFGLALSLPLVLAVFWARGRRWIDRLGALAERIPTWTGVALIALGTWSIGFAFIV